MNLIRKAGATSQIVQFFVGDSSSTVGAGLAGLADNTFRLICYYNRNTDAAATAVALVPMVAGTWTSSGLIEVNGTFMQGIYQLGIPDAALAAGAESCTIYLWGASNMMPVIIDIDLHSQVDMVSVSGSAVSTASAQIGVNVVKFGGTVQTAGDIGQVTADILVDTGTTLDGRIPAALAGGRMDSSVGAYPGNTAQTGDGYALANGASGFVATKAVADAIQAKTDNLPSAVKKNTALSNFEVFMVLAADHYSAATGLTVACSRSIDGGAFGASTNTPCTEVSNGIYKINLSAADLNGDVITLRFSVATADDRFITILTKS